MLQAFLRQALLLDFTPARRWSYFCFAGSLLVALASHQFVGPVKVAIFFDLVGSDVEPVAKSVVMLVLLPVLVGYSMLVSYLNSAERLVMMVCGFYTVLFSAITFIHWLSGGHPEPWLAWVLYYATETKGVIIMPMIWSVIAEASTSALAKKAYPIMFFVVQVGGILGSLVAIQISDLGGEVGLLFMQAASFAVVAALAVAACRLAAADVAVADDAGAASASAAPLAAEGGSGGGSARELAPPESVWAVGLAKAREGFEGLWLLLSRPYVFMTFWVSYANLMPRTILDYQNSVLGVNAYDSREAQIAYFGKVNMMINGGTALLTLVGTGPIVEAIGVGQCLLILPVGMLLCIWSLCADYSLQMSTAALVLVCIIAYGLNSPCKEMLYVRTSRDIKYKAKSWSEMYGNQVMKLFGAQVNLWVNREGDLCTPHCFQSGTTALVSGLWVGGWLAVAARIGAQHRQLEAEDKIVS